MNELAMQKLIVDTVNESGGFALKMSHRFLVGIPDLLVKLVPAATDEGARHLVTGILEVKQRDYMADASRPFKLDVTEPQKNYLYKAQQAGTPTGVVSFMQEKNKGIRGLWVCVYDYSDMKRNNWHGVGKDHHRLGGPAERGGELLYRLRDFFIYAKQGSAR